MSTTTVKSFVKQFLAIIQGDDAKAKAEKVFRQAQSALNTYISSSTGDTIELEDKVEEAANKLAIARVNGGENITDRAAYVRNLLSAKNALTEAQENLEKHKVKLAFFKEELANLELDVTE